MSENDVFPEPKRILQIYDPVAQAAYKNWSAHDKLEWLAAIIELYWAALKQTKSNEAA